MTSCSLINAADPRATLSSRDQRTPSAACLPTAHDLRMIGGGGGVCGGEELDIQIACHYTWPLLGHSHTHSLPSWRWLILSSRPQGGSWGRDHTAPGGPEMLTVWPFAGGFASPGSRSQRQEKQRCPLRKCISPYSCKVGDKTDDWYVESEYQ